MANILIFLLTTAGSMVIFSVACKVSEKILKKKDKKENEEE